MSARVIAPRLSALGLALLCGCSDPSLQSLPAPSPAPLAAPLPAPPAVQAPPVRRDGTIYAESELMGTRFSINLWLPPGQTAEAAGAAIELAFAEIDRIEGLASEWRPDSELSQLSAAAGGEPRPLSPDLYTLLQRSKVVAEATDGAFDPTFHAVGQLWSFRPGAIPPSAEAIADKLPLVDWREIELTAEGRRGRLRRAGMKLGLGAIAKGYAVDRAAQLLSDRGFTDHIVEGGGDTFVSGTKGGAAWMVGIQRPDGPGSVGALPLQDRALVTSGGYQRYFEHAGRRYSHIIDPRSGWPLDEAASALSVSVLAPDATDADAYCTAVAVMGPARGMEFIESRPELDAVIITHDRQLLISSGLTERFIRPPAP
jgi:thiamine biosynthesis lipoprotein